MRVGRGRATSAACGSEDVITRLETLHSTPAQATPQTRETRSSHEGKLSGRRVLAGRSRFERPSCCAPRVAFQSRRILLRELARANALAGSFQQSAPWPHAMVDGIMCCALPTERFVADHHLDVCARRGRRGALTTARRTPLRAALARPPTRSGRSSWPHRPAAAAAAASRRQASTRRRCRASCDPSFGALLWGPHL